jgi:MIP family channel proteins
VLSTLAGVQHDYVRRGLAEFIGAFTLTFVGAGAAMTARGVGDTALIGVAIANGVAIAVMVSALGHISGGHFNPAITFGFVVTRRISAKVAAVYWAAQFGAASIAALLLWWIFPNNLVDAAKLGAPTLTSSLTQGQGFVVEAIGTFLLVLVVFAVAVDERGSFKSVAGLPIGLMIAIYVLLAGPLTGSAINPSRAFGPMLVHNVWSHGWIWYVGPLLGGAIAALVYELFYLSPPKPMPVGPPETGVVEPRPGDAAAS